MEPNFQVANWTQSMSLAYLSSTTITSKDEILSIYSKDLHSDNALVVEAIAIFFMPNAFLPHVSAFKFQEPVSTLLRIHSVLPHAFDVEFSPYIYETILKGSTGQETNFFYTRLIW